MYSSYNDLLVAMDPSASMPETSQLGNCDRIRLSSGGEDVNLGSDQHAGVTKKKSRKPCLNTTKKGN